MDSRHRTQFPALEFACATPGVLELIMSKPGRLNAADRDMHRELSLV